MQFLMRILFGTNCGFFIRQLKKKKKKKDVHAIFIKSGKLLLHNLIYGVRIKLIFRNNLHRAIQYVNNDTKNKKYFAKNINTTIFPASAERCFSIKLLLLLFLFLLLLQNGYNTCDA